MLGVPRENFVVVSGIGCSSRFPYYVNTYGFHGIHGRAPAVATGIKLNNPALSVWVMTGDGDGLAIGGNHFIHLMRRNADIKVILFNNAIYGLTKGQASPTTQVGTKTKTTPYGSEEIPVKPLALALAAGATFAARVNDTDTDLLSEVFLAAGKHKGVAFVEVLVNCAIYNDKAFAAITARETKTERTIRLKHGQPVVFGANNDKAIKLKGIKPEVVSIEPGKAASDILVHDIHNPDSTPAFLLSQMEYPDNPVPFGIFRQVSRPVFKDKTEPRPTDQDFKHLLESGGFTWKVDSNGNIGSV